jgi:hypothetical protein
MCESSNRLPLTGYPWSQATSIGQCGNENQRTLLQMID